jgi:diadenosine tetraphosphatase ApaH/serine/threonine PP2A family protein phosphatase
VLSDIHANRPALEAVLSDAPLFDIVWCLGDVVGYGPDPNECIELLRELRHFSLAGNHDWGVLGKLGLSEFNADARRASMWTRAALTPVSREYLSQLPVKAELEGFCLTHASPREPVWEYVLDTSRACANFAHFANQTCLVGHSHLPLVFQLDERRGRCEMPPHPFRGPLALDRHRMILNPGSVGQPRDGDPRASYAVLDTDAMTWEFHRVSYPVEIVQERMRAQRFPRRLIERLTYGR